MNETKRKPLYMPWSEEAFRADIQVMAMTPLQRWMYRTLLQAAFFHSTRPYLPDDDTQLWMLAGCENEKQWERNKAAVRAAFTPIEIDGVCLLSRKRLVEDWTRIMEKRQALAEAGRKGGQANAKPEQSKCLSDAKPGEAQAKPELSKEVKGSEVKEVKKFKTNTTPQTGAVAVELPDWLPKEEWNGYLKMRKRIRKDATPEAMALAIRDLEKLRTAGNDPKLVLEQSILNSWQGVFELRLSREDRARLEDQWRNRDALTGSHRNPVPEIVTVLTPEQEVEIEKTRWKELEAGTLSKNAANVAWVNMQRARLKGKIEANDPRPGWFRKFFAEVQAA